MNLFTDDHPETTLHGLQFSNPTRTRQSIQKIENYFDNQLSQQTIPGTIKRFRPHKQVSNYTQAERYFQNQKMTRVLSLYNRGQSIIHKTINPDKKKNLAQSLLILKDWIHHNKIGGKDCCLTTKKDKKCIRKSDGKLFKLPRKFSQKKCRDPKGFSMKASCAPYLDC